jgi:hypothetical protein
MRSKGGEVMRYLMRSKGDEEIRSKKSFPLITSTLHLFIFLLFSYLPIDY